MKVFAPGLLFLVALLSGVIVVSIVLGTLLVPGDILAYSAQYQRKSAIFLLDAKNRLSLRITDQAHTFVCPIWSPDGSKLAVRRYDGTGMHIVIVDPLSGDSTNLTRTLFGAKSSLRWSPDGQFLAFHHENDLYIGEIRTNNLIRVTETKTLSTMPLWSLDSSLLVYNEGGEILLYELSTRTHTPVTTRGAGLSYHEPLYFYDDSTLMIGIHSERQRDFYLLNIDTLNMQPLLPFDGDMMGQFAWSAGGDQLVYMQYGDGFQVYTWQQNTLFPTFVTDRMRGVLSWSPDQRFAVVTYDFDTTTKRLSIFGITADGQERILLANMAISGRVVGANAMRFAEWSRTGDYLLLGMLQDGNPPTMKHYIIDVREQSQQDISTAFVGCVIEVSIPPQWQP